MVADNEEEGQAGGKPPSASAKPLARILVKRLCIFLLVLSGSALFFWLVGNFRNFLDSTQLVLLGVLRYSALGLVVAAAVGLGIFLGFGAIEGPLKKRLRELFLGAAGYLFLLLLGTGLGLLAEALYVLTGGLAGPG